MSVWYAIPSKRPAADAEHVLKFWRYQGYKIALVRDFVDLDFYGDLTYFSEPIWGGYPGYAPAVNYLCKQILLEDSEAEWIVTGGDDILPDPMKTAEEIARECSDHFWLQSFAVPTPGVDRSVYFQTFERDFRKRALFGVMQATGDRWGEDDPYAKIKWPDRPAYIDRVCGSPFMGREFCRRMYGGDGPLYHGYRHMFEDEELQAVAERLGVLWQRRDLTHHHQHYARQGKPCPEFLKEVSGQKHWAESQLLFTQRQAAGFPGHEPIP